VIPELVFLSSSEEALVMKIAIDILISHYGFLTGRSRIFKSQEPFRLKWIDITTEPKKAASGNKLE
jgi:hypothetical protein